VANGAQTAYKFPQPGNYDITLTVLNEAGCANQLTKTVEIFQAPTAQFDMDLDFGAPPLEVEFSNTSVNADAYSWDFGDASNSISIEKNPAFIFNAIQEYNIRLIAQNDFGCSDTIYSKVSSKIPIVDLELLKLEPSLNNDKINLNIVNSGTVKIDGFNIRIALADDFSIVETYTQSLNAGQQILCTLNFEIPVGQSNLGYVCVHLEDNIDSSEDSNIINNEKCVNFEQQLIIENPFPNPADDEINLKLILPSKSNVDISLLNIQGETVYFQSFPDIMSGLNIYSLDTKDLNNGMYFIKINTGQTQEIKRILKF
jgi:PKD repeat protein